jgi:hypothetical protein
MVVALAPSSAPRALLALASTLTAALPFPAISSASASVASGQ